MGSAAVPITDDEVQARRSAVSDPTRMRILGLLGSADGLTAKELAQRLRLDPNRLYYHLRILESAGVIEVSEHRASDRRSERVYVVADIWPLKWDAKDPGAMAAHLGALLEVTKLDAEESLYARAERRGKARPFVTWNMPAMTTTHEEIELFAQRVFELVQEFRARARQSKPAGTKARRLRFTWVVSEGSPDRARTAGSPR